MAKTPPQKPKPKGGPPRRDGTPQDSPRQYPQVFTKHVPGRKGRRTRGAGLQRLGACGFKAVPRGPYSADLPKRYKDSRPDAGAQKPLAAAAVKLLFDYHRYSAFWGAVEDGAPVEDAGAQILGLAKTRARAVLNELRSHNGPLNWFRDSALSLMGAGKLARGRDTEPSNYADAFYTALWGGRKALKSVQDAQADVEEINLDGIRRGLKREGKCVDMEIFDYLCYSRLLWRLD